MSKARAKPSRGEGALQKASRDVVDAQFRSGMGHQPPPGERREPPVSRAVRTDNRFDGVERSWGPRSLRSALFNLTRRPPSRFDFAPPPPLTS